MQSDSQLPPELIPLAKFLASRKLSAEQMDRIQEIFVSAPKADRLLIGKLYPQLFVDSKFVQGICARMDAMNRQARMPPASLASVNKEESNNNGDTNTNAVEVDALDEGKPRRRGKDNRAMDHGYIAVRQAIAELPKLTGPGPFTIELCLVGDEPTNQKIISLYSSQFTYPDVPELQRIVTSPRFQSTRRKRAQLSGVFSWFVLCQSTGEIAAAVTTVIHNVETMRFVEVPLCATANGYKKLGFARLLSSALQRLCAESLKAEVILVTAETHAVAFWEKCGFSEMSRQLKARLDFYLIQCHKFKESKLLTWEAKQAPDDVGELVQSALSKMPKFLIENDRLPWDVEQ